VLRIPTAKLDAAIMQLKKLGRVENVSQSTQDVTGQARDLDVCSTALTTSVDRLVELLARASTAADLISIESSLADRQASLESLQSQKRALGDQVDLATLAVEFGTVIAAPVRPPAGSSPVSSPVGVRSSGSSPVSWLSSALFCPGRSLQA